MWWNVTTPLQLHLQRDQEAKGNFGKHPAVHASVIVRTWQCMSFTSICTLSLCSAVFVVPPPRCRYQEPMHQGALLQQVKMPGSNGERQREMNNRGQTVHEPLWSVTQESLRILYVCMCTFCSWLTRILWLSLCNEGWKPIRYGPISLSVSLCVFVLSVKCKGNFIRAPVAKYLSLSYRWLYIHCINSFFFSVILTCKLLIEE